MAGGELPPVSEAGPTRIVVADDHPLFRSALVQIVNGRSGLEVVGEAANGREALELCRRFQPELVLMDMRMREMDGLEATRGIKEEFPKIVVLILSALENPNHLSEAIRAGAAGYILKYATAQQIVEAIGKVLDGDRVLDEEVAQKLLLELLDKEPKEKPAHPASGEHDAKPLAPPGSLVQLTPREDDVLRLMARGQSNQEIADNLFVSVGTVKKYTQRLFAKLEVSDRTQAVVRAMELNLLAEEGGHSR